MRILRAALALESFTIGELAAHCDANVNTVRNQVTTRDRELFEQVGDVATIGRGRPRNRYRLRDPEAAQALLRAHQRALTPGDEALIARTASPLELPAVELQSPPAIDPAASAIWAGGRLARSLRTTDEAARRAFAEMARDEATAALAGGTLDEPQARLARLVADFGTLLAAERVDDAQWLARAADSLAAVLRGTDQVTARPYLRGLLTIAREASQPPPVALLLASDLDPADVLGRSDPTSWQSRALPSSGLVLWTPRWLEPLRAPRAFAGVVIHLGDAPGRGLRVTSALEAVRAWSVPLVMTAGRDPIGTARAALPAGAVVLPEPDLELALDWIGESLRGRPTAEEPLVPSPVGVQATEAGSERASSDPDPLMRIHAVLVAGAAHLEARRHEVNDLNVFPVVDGDTGDNLALTLQAVLTQLEELAEQGGIDEIGRQAIVDAVARAALLGARGESGVILSQLVRGAAEELVSRPGELVDPVLAAAAMARAAARAYGAVREPVEGTILTVAREMAARAASEIAHMAEPRLQRRVDEPTQNEMLAYVLEHALDAGEESVKRGPERLPVLLESGVVDAGGYALTLIVSGMIAALRGYDPPAVTGLLPPPRPSRRSQHRSSTYRYCVRFAVTGTQLDAATALRSLTYVGDCLSVVGDGTTLRIHLHTDDPELATAPFEDDEVSHLDVADMEREIEEHRTFEPVDRCGVLAVINGDGMRSLFEGMGATVVDGGPTLNPSTYEILAGIHDTPAEEVVVLPNSPNVRMAAERAAELSEKTVRVVPTRSMAAGLAAAVALDTGTDARHNAAAMEESIRLVRTGGVAEASRDDTQGRFRQGESLGFIDEELVAWGEPQETLEVVLGELGREAELLTVIEGDDPPLESTEVAALAPDRAQVEVSRGGQAAWWLLSARRD